MSQVSPPGVYDTHIIYSWMYRPDGLNLKRRSLALDVYAAIYKVSESGQGAYMATQSELAKTLCAERARVNQALKRLLDDGLIYQRMSWTKPTGGRPIKFYSANLEKAFKAMQSSTTPIAEDKGFYEPTEEEIEKGFSEALEKAEKLDATDPIVAPRIPQNVLENAEMSFQQTAGQSVVENFEAVQETAGKTNVPQKHIEAEQCAAKAHSQSNVPQKHIASTCGNESFQQSVNIETRRNTKSLNQSKSSDDFVDSSKVDSLDGVQETYFRELLELSPIPVDENHLPQVRSNFIQALNDGIPGDVLVEALKDYSAYACKIMRSDPNYRPMFLEPFLRRGVDGHYHQSIEFVLKRRGHTTTQEEIRARIEAQNAVKNSQDEISSPDEAKLFKATSMGDEGRWCYSDRSGFHMLRIPVEASHEEALAAMVEDRASRKR